MSIKSSKYKEKVFLNVYDLNPSNDMTHKYGVGAYHSGLVVHGKEHSFGQGGGIYTHPPGKGGEGQPGVKFREKILLGTTTKNSREIQDDFDSLRPYFKGDDYNVVKRNCNHFTETFAKKIFETNKPVIPKWVNRGAGIGNFFTSFLPGGGKAPKQPEIKEGFRSFQGSGHTLRESEEESKGGGSKKRKQKKKQQPKKRSWIASWWYGDGEKKKENGTKKKSRSLKKKKKGEEVEEEVPKSPQDDRERILQATLARLGQSGGGKNEENLQ